MTSRTRIPRRDTRHRAHTAKAQFTTMALALGLAGGVRAAPTPRSGPQPGSQVLPLTSDLVTGPYRGQQHCYICDVEGSSRPCSCSRDDSAPLRRD